MKSFPVLVGIFSLAFAACSPTPGPDKTAAGTILGAAWGAGTGAIAGNQVDSRGPGAAVGAAVGATAGMLTGIGLDVAEGQELEQHRELDALKVQVASNGQALGRLQDTLDSRDSKLRETGLGIEQIFFDSDSASLRLGSAGQLERLANKIKMNPYVGSIEIHGHTDDTGNLERNLKLSEARARTVATFFSNQGVSLDKMRLIGHGAERPLASNESQSGRQLNRRVEIVLMK